MSKPRALRWAQAPHAQPHQLSGTRRPRWCSACGMQPGAPSTPSISGIPSVLGCAHGLDTPQTPAGGGCAPRPSVWSGADVPGPCPSPGGRPCLGGKQAYGTHLGNSFYINHFFLLNLTSRESYNQQPLEAVFFLLLYALQSSHSHRDTVGTFGDRVASGRQLNEPTGALSCRAGSTVERGWSRGRPHGADVRDGSSRARMAAGRRDPGRGDSTGSPEKMAPESVNPRAP
ncbi:uncharacterized protein LOC120584721 isoform X1 [Pteropus medius]|uniref:uncharacterized protein LOC120584721 isoform X1 n=1 Tax=Pteropus vampyrus TaxID=132908 RepID=UPI00196B9982|nr:uncharacterized protein LOC120584721 isoform X1 [Pteropus giganteus]